MMEPFDLLSLERFRAPKIQDYVAVIGKVTRVMNLRIVRKSNSDKYPYSTLFQCGVDILPLANGGHVIITTLGFYAFTFAEFVQRFLEYERRRVGSYGYYCQRGALSAFVGLGFIFTDDTDALSIWDYDDNGNIIEDNVEPQYVDDGKLLEGVGNYDSMDQFVEELTHNA